MNFWKPEFMAIHEDLLLIMKRSNNATSVIELDRCIVEYKKVLGSLEDETAGLKCIVQLRESKAQKLIVSSGANLIANSKKIKLN